MSLPNGRDSLRIKPDVFFILQQSLSLFVNDFSNNLDQFSSGRGLY